jgi:hypothetical protein
MRFMSFAEPNYNKLRIAASQPLLLFKCNDISAEAYYYYPTYSLKFVPISFFLIRK